MFKKRFATLYICQIFGSLCFADYFKELIIKRPIIYTNKTTFLEEFCELVVVLLEKQYTKGASQNVPKSEHIHKNDSNNTPYLLNHTLVFCLKIHPLSQG